MRCGMSMTEALLVLGKARGLMEIYGEVVVLMGAGSTGTGTNEALSKSRSPESSDLSDHIHP